MKVVGIAGSPRSGGNTEIAVGAVLEEVAKQGMETELISLAGRNIQPCQNCLACFKNKDRRCGQEDDFNAVWEKMREADGIVLGSPVYFSSATPQIMALVDRAGFVSMANGGLLKRKVGGPVVVGRRAGLNFTFAQLLYFYLCTEMIVPGSTYWNVAFGMKPGEVKNDAEGMKAMRDFGANIAWVLQKTRAQGGSFSGCRSC